MFIISPTCEKPVEEVDRLSPGHYIYIDQYAKAGKFVPTGPKVPRRGGVIICNVSTRKEPNAIMQEAPFTTHRIGDFETAGFSVTRIGLPPK